MSYTIPRHIPAEIFRAYDIRGETGPYGITPDLAYTIGLAVGSEAHEHSISHMAVGRDARLSSPALKTALVAGLLETGIQIFDLGMIPTPLLYFATHTSPTQSGIMVTASHNPAHHNGFKLVLNQHTLHTTDILKLYQRIIEQRFVSPAKTGTSSPYPIIPAYTRAVIERTHCSRSLKVVVDCGNGVAGQLVPDLYRQLGCEVIELFCEVDGHFPNHHPDPTVPDNLTDLIKAVRQSNADIGLAFDGDADRAGMVTNRGEIIWPDHQLMLFAMDALSRHPGSKIIFDVKCTQHLETVIRKHGGHPIMYRSGHSLLKDKMLEEDAILAGEMSGHLFFKEHWFSFDDGIYAGAQLLHMLSKTQQSSSAIFSALPQGVSTPELKIAIPEQDKNMFMQRLLKEADFGEAKRITIDGLRVEWPQGWGLIRPSNTTPYLTLRFEADSAQHLAEIQSLFREQILAIDSTLIIPSP